MRARRARAGRAAAVAVACLVALLAAACGRQSTADRSLDGRLLPRGGTAITGPAEGTGPAPIGTYRFTAGESLGVVIHCAGRGRVWLRGSGGGQLAHVQAVCGGGSSGSALWRAPSGEHGVVHVVARGSTRWRVALYRCPVPLDDDSSPVATPSASSSPGGAAPPR